MTRRLASGTVKGAHSVQSSIFPRPRTLEIGDGPGPADDVPLRAAVDESLPPQGYVLSTGPDGVHVRHRDPAGLRYALATLDQLRADRTWGQRAIKVHDWPDFEVRGFLLDISRDRVPTRRTLARWVQLLAMARYNQLELYIEHTFASVGHEKVWQDASPLTPKDLRWLDARCAAAGIALVPNQNTLGHWERWLAHDAYRCRAENAGGFEVGGEHQPPSTLAPTPENAEFVGQLLDELADCYRTRCINVGADEPWELGTGVSRQRTEQVGLGMVYFDYVERVVRRWTERGYRVEFWADVFGEHPELMDRVPPGAVPVVWQYDAPSLIAAVLDASSPEGTEAREKMGLKAAGLRLGFRDRAKVLIDAGVPFWVAPGASNWNTLVGRVDNAMENLVDAAQVGLEHGAGGYLTTSWGDRGMFDPPSVSFGPVLFGGAVSWCLEANRDLDLIAVLNEHALLDPSRTTGQVLQRAGLISGSLGVPMLNCSPLARALMNGGVLPTGSTPSDEALEDAVAEVAACLELLRGADPACADGDVVVRELTQALRLTAFSARLLVERSRGGGELAPAAARRLLRELQDLEAEQRACWLLRSRPGGLDDSLARLTPVRRALMRRAAA